MVVADSGPLIALARLDLLRLLPIHFDPVLVPEAVFVECTAYGDRPGARVIRAASEASLFVRVPVADADQFARDHLLDPGEAAVLVLARTRACPVLVDERRGRRIASRLEIPVVGTVGLLLAAHHAGHVGALAPFFDALTAFGYRLSPELIQGALRRTGEN